MININDLTKIDTILRIFLGSFFLVISTLALSAPIIQTVFGYPKGENIYILLSPICHQYPTRSFWIMSRPFAICSRCFGGYLGLSIGLYFIHSSGKYIKRLLYGLLLILPGVSDGMIQFYTDHESTNIFRFVTGTSGGIGLFLMAYPFQKIQLNKKKGEQK